MGGGRFDFITSSSAAGSLSSTLKLNSSALETINNALRLNDILTISGSNLLLGGQIQSGSSTQGLTMAGTGTLRASAGLNGYLLGWAGLGLAL